MLTQLETRRLMQKAKNEKKRPRFVQPNHFLSPGIIDDVAQICSHFYVDDVMKIVETLGLEKTPVFYRSEKVDGRYMWSKMNIEDIICMVGTNEYADAIGPMKFKGGPQMECRIGTKDKPYTLMCGTLLTWCMDQILYYVSIRGNEVWNELGLPL